MNQSPAGNQYDFIMNPGQAPKKRLIGGGNSLKSRLLLIAGGAVVLMILMALISTLLGSADKNAVNSLKSLVSQQEELIRIAAIGSAEATDITTRSFAATVKLSVESQQKSLTDYLEERKIKLSKEELASKKNKNTDEELDSARSSNRFDEELTTVLKSQLDDYSTGLTAAKKSTTNKTAISIINASLTNTDTLIN